ncbi:MAG: cobalamin B12-binding domain-containing protein [Ignavibacteriaceae bacterium]|nr:cobalamin B12-binding domain-containing protein [Ignavibacteriaceae bacterium]
MIKEVQFLEYTNGLLDGDKDKCIEVVEYLLSQNVDIKDIYVDLFQRSMYHVGKMWEQGRLSIADEHLGTEITKSLMNRYAPKIASTKKINKTALVSCVDKEFHEIGARMAADVFELNGWHTYFLGACTPTREILKFIDIKRPDVVGLSFNFYLNIHRLYEVIDHIRKDYPNQQIIVGGQALVREKEKLLDEYKYLKLFSTVKELDSYLKEESKAN